MYKVLKKLSPHFILLVAVIFFVWLIFFSNPSKDQLYSVPLEKVDYGNKETHDKNQQYGHTKQLYLKERYCKKFNLGGFVFDEKGVSKEISQQAISCLIHSFSPQIEYEASRRFLDPPRENVFYGNSPAILMYKDEVVLVSRIWLDRERYEDKGNWPSNQFADNWLYMQKFNNHMKPINHPSILGIPTPKQWWVGDGPIEPRLFACQDQLFISFNTAMAFAKNYLMDYTVIWNVNKNLPVIPDILGGSPMINATEKNDMPRDKHWTALVIDDQLYFVHNLDPLRVLKCSLQGQCTWAHKEEGHGGFIFSDAHSHLRGGTPFELYKHPYHVSVAHTTMYKNSSMLRYYSAHIVLIRVLPFRVVYLSQPIRIHKKLFLQAPMVRKRFIDQGFMFPVGLIVEANGDLSIGVHVNDYNSIVVRIKGARKILERVILEDVSQPPVHGPPSGFLNRHVHSLLQNITHTSMVHQRV